MLRRDRERARQTERLIVLIDRVSPHLNGDVWVEWLAWAERFRSGGPMVSSEMTHAASAVGAIVETHPHLANLGRAAAAISHAAAMATMEPGTAEEEISFAEAFVDDELSDDTA